MVPNVAGREGFHVSYLGRALKDTGTVCATTVLDLAAQHLQRQLPLGQFTVDTRVIKAD